MNKILVLALTMLIMHTEGKAQTRHLVTFKNKGSNPFSLNAPAAYLSSRSIDRRTRYGIAIDSTDMPVTPRYLDSLRSVPNVTILNASKWLNQVAIQTSDAAAIAKINSFSFVQSALPIAARTINQTTNKFAQEGSSSSGYSFSSSRGMADYFDYGATYPQIHLHNGEFLHNIGLKGQGMIIAMLDAGYQNYLAATSLDSARSNGQILGTYDFVNNEISVNEDHSHGMVCLSIMAGNIPGKFVGTAPYSHYFLFRTEDAATEYPIEEFNWVCGAERVDSAGGDLISSSLGYTVFDNPVFNHTYAQMNGNTTIAAIGADLAAKKGVLVVNAAGNDGSNPWHYISTPADGDSVLAVGAVNASGAVGGLSSYGPSYDGQVKPDVAAVGINAVVQFPNNAIGTSNGTSLACPNMAGLAACLWQGFKEVNNMRIVTALRQAGSIASAPNDRIGYGIPDVKKAVVQLTKEFSTATANISACKTILAWTSKDMGAMKYEIERKAPGEAGFTKIAERTGTGSVFGTKSYTLSDSLLQISSGTISYRIRQVFDSASASFTADYIDTVNVALSASCPVVAANNEMTLLPNPANNRFEIKLSSPEAISILHIKVVDALGKEVILIATSKPAGTSFLPVNINYLAKGKYFVSVYAKGSLLGTRELLKL